MILVNCEQGWHEWHLMRCGRITASNFRIARTRLKTGKNAGDWSADAKSYAFTVAVERIGGVPLDDEFETYPVKRGGALEPEARIEHEIQTGQSVMRAGFVMTDDGLFGASADGFIGEDGGSEYKCLIGAGAMRKVLFDEAIDEYMDQVQGCLWITGRAWWDFCVYCPILRPIGKQLWWRRIKRDEDYIAALKDDLDQFRALVNEYEHKVRNPS